MTSNPSINCAICGRPAELLEHRFIEGDPARPVRAWTIVAPLYFNVAKRHGYCGPACSTKGHMLQGVDGT
jgi:hypothetical protein